MKIKIGGIEDGDYFVEVTLKKNAVDHEFDLHDGYLSDIMNHYLQGELMINYSKEILAD